MAGETYGSPGFAFSGAMEDYLLKSEELKHRAFMDNLTLKKELREEAADKADAEIRREQLAATKEDRATKARAAKVKESNDYLANDVAPGDILDKSVIDDREALGLPTPLGPIPQKPTAGVPPALAEDPSTMANVPAALSIGRPYLGNVQQRARQALLDTLPAGSPERAAVEYEGATGRSLPAGVLRVALPTPRPTAEPSFVAYGPDGKTELPGIVAMTGTGEALLNGQKLPEGATVRRAPTPRDPLLDRLTQAEINAKNEASKETPLIRIGDKGQPEGWKDGVWSVVSTIPKGAHVLPAAPGASAAAQRGVNIQTGKSAVTRLRSDVQEADAAGLIGPGAGRWYTALAKLGTTGDPKKDELIGRLKGDILLTKMHVDAGIGGTRAASSPLLLKNWEDIALSGSKDLIMGYTNAIDSDMGATGGSGDKKKSLDDLWNDAHSGRQ